MWHLAHDMLHMTSDKWHETFEMWNVTPDLWHMVWVEHSLQISTPRSWSLGWTVSWIFLTKGSLNEWMIYNSAYRTAPTTPGLLNTRPMSKKIWIMKRPKLPNLGSNKAFGDIPKLNAVGNCLQNTSVNAWICDIRWLIAWAKDKSLRLCPRDFPCSH